MGSLVRRSCKKQGNLKDTIRSSIASKSDEWDCEDYVEGDLPFSGGSMP